MSRKYDEEFKKEAVRLSDEIGVKRASAQLGIVYNTLSDWRGKRSKHGDKAFVGSGHKYADIEGMTKREIELQRENEELYNPH